MNHPTTAAANTGLDAGAVRHWTLELAEGRHLCVAPTFSCPHTRAVLVDEDEADPAPVLWRLLALAEGELVDLDPAPGFRALAWARVAAGRVSLHAADAGDRERLAATLALNGLAAAVCWLPGPRPAAPAPGAVVHAAVDGSLAQALAELEPWVQGGAQAVVLRGLGHMAQPLSGARWPPGWRAWRFSAALGVLLPGLDGVDPACGDEPVVLLAPALAARLGAVEALVDTEAPAATPPAGGVAQHVQSVWQLAGRLADQAKATPSADLDAQRVLVLQALGRTAAALALARPLLARRDAGTPCPTPQAEALAGVDGAVLWASLREFVLDHAAGDGGPDPDAWTAALADPAHSARAERAALVAHLAADRMPSALLLSRLQHLANNALNRPLWTALLGSAQALSALPPALVTAADDSPEQLLAALGQPRVQIVDVGASSLGEGSEPYAELARHGPVLVTGFEPDAEALAELQRRHAGDDSHRFLPHFVGDGAEAVFHETNWSLTGSLLPPHRPVQDRYQNLGSLTLERARHPVRTVRLDDVIAPGGMDLLKVDVQGGEGLVLDGARARLAECLLVWIEVEFLELYRGQPLYPEIDRRLREQGLQFFSFVGIGHRPLASFGAMGDIGRAPRHLQQVWADAVYLPTPERIQALDADRALRLALLAHHVLGAWDQCHAALLRLEAAGGRRGAAAAYRERMRVRARVQERPTQPAEAGAARGRTPAVA